MTAEVIEGRIPWRAAPNVVPMSRPTFRDLAALAGSFGDALDIALGAPRKSANAADLIMLSERLDTAALNARNMGYALNKSALLVVAQDIESLSERIVHLAAELGDIE